MTPLLRNLLLIITMLCCALVQAGQIPASNIKIGTAKYHPNGQLSQARLLKTMEIQSYPCKNWVAFSPEGKLIAFDAARDIPLGKDILPAGSRFALYPGGAIKHVLLAKASNIQGLLCVGYGVESPEINFWPNGRIKSAYLKKAQAIKGFIAKAGSFTPVVFHDDGTLQSLTLDKEAVIGAKTYKAGTKLSFNNVGKLNGSSRPGFLKRLGRDLLDIVL